MITKTNETKSFRAEREGNGYLVVANVVTDNDDNIKSVDAGDVYQSKNNAQQATFYKYPNANTAITFMNNGSITEIAMEIDLFINELTNNAV